MNELLIKNCLNRNGIPYRDELPEKLNIYFSMLQEWNSRMDLTAVTDDNETLDKHFIDSLTVLKKGLLRTDSCLIDVGTGAGFPGMVLAIACPEMKVTLLDSQQKRLLFLEKTAEATDTVNISIIHARAEDGARRTDLRERFDYAVARALAPMNVLCEYLLPYVRINGYALCWKGPALMNEMDAGRKASRLLGGSLEMPVACDVNGRDWKHMILPAIVLGWSSSGSIARLTRSNLLEAMRNDYIRTARAKGLQESGVIWRHALKNAMMPVVTTMATQVASLLSGATITETVFAIGGIGRLTVDSLRNRDIPLLQGSLIFSTALIIVGNLVADIMYTFLDPRVRV